MEAELAAQWQRADFFWRQVQIELKALSKQQNAWQDLAEAVASDQVRVMNDPIQLRQHLVDELFIDTHCAFYNGLMQQVAKPSWQERAFVHIDYIQQLLEYSAISGEGVRSLLEQPLQTRIALCKEAKKWKQAIQYCTQGLKYLPNDIDIQNELAEIYYLAALAKLPEAVSETQHLQNTKTLRSSIKNLEKCLKNYPYNLKTFQVMGGLYYQQAISLANSNQLADSLVSIQKAITYNPYLRQAFKARDELMETMKQLQNKMRQVLLEIKLRHGWQLHQKGRRALEEANKGFSRMNIYIDSDEAKETASAFHVAEAVHLWHNIGFPEPAQGWREELPAAVMRTADGKTIPIESSSSWKRKALQLWDGVNSVLNSPPQNKAELTAAWEAVIVQKPDLAGLNSALICAFVEHKLFGEGSFRVLVTPPPHSAGEPPILRPVDARRQPGAEPLLPWLFSRQDRRIKLQASVASVLVLVAGGLVLQDRLRSSARDAAYQQILAAERWQEDLDVVKGAEDFFANAPLNGKDERKQQVIELYRKSLVRWFVQQGDLPDANAKMHLERYRQVMNTVKPEDNQP